MNLTKEIYLAKPRGFCAGVDRAILIVKQVLKKYGAPVYVRHEIVHNKYVVEDLKQQGVIFVENLVQIPENSVVIFSAHGVAKDIEIEALQRNLIVINATCPLVTKVHLEAQNHEKLQRDIILIGHHGHPEVAGTSGQVKQKIHLISNEEDIENLPFTSKSNLAFITQTTLSVADTQKIVTRLKQKFPQIIGPDLKNICYATHNRQLAVKELANLVDLVLVIGSENSSNSNRLLDIALKENKLAYLIDGHASVDLKWFDKITKIGITAGASAPELLVEQLINFLSKNFTVTINEIITKEEKVIFNLPPELRDI